MGREASRERKRCAGDGGPTYRSSLNPESTAGRCAAFATNQPVRYIHRAIRVSLG